MIFPLIFVVVGAIFAHPLITPIFFALAYGIFLHQIGDMLTISGIPHYFFPISRKKAVLLPQILRFRTGSIAEKIILIFVLTPLIAISAVFIFGDATHIQNLQNLKVIDKIIKLLGEILG